MHIDSRQWQRPLADSHPSQLAAPTPTDFAGLHRRLGSSTPSAAARQAARELIEQELQAARQESCDLPEHPDDLLAWMQLNAQAVQAKYLAYLQERKSGGPRRFFRNRAHALNALRGVAPTKLVDGAWLHGVVAQWRNPLAGDLVRTYVEELGEGDPSKNHVVLYRKLLERHGLEPLDDLPDALYRQGAIQLALGCNAGDFLPEIIGFNLGYEQLPLHLLITAYELNELGLDPYYFTLHVTVDNEDTGHARRACDAVQKMLPRLPDGGAFWQRVREGSKLAHAGVGTADVIAGFDDEEEVIRILQRKAGAGAGAHSDYCRIEGRPINDWLASPQEITKFIAALEARGWIQRDSPPAASRFWNLLQGPRAEMFGVFSPYELQVIHDWLRGAASADGASFEQDPGHDRPMRQPSHRAAQKLQAARGAVLVEMGPSPALDADESELEARLATLDVAAREALLVEMMGPAHHWTLVGMRATRHFCSALRTA